MNSHEYANGLAEIAEFLLSKPAFDTRHSTPKPYLYFWTEKEKFLEAVRALGAGTKEYKTDELFFHAGDFVTLVVQRSAVCRKVQEEKWECEPLLSDSELQSIGS